MFSRSSFFHPNHQSGSAAILLALLVSLSIGTGAYFLSDRIVATQMFEKKLELTETLSTESFAAIESVAQLVQSGTLNIDVSGGKFAADSSAFISNTGWQLLNGTNGSTIQTQYCKSNAASDGINDLLDKDRKLLTCSADQQVSALVKINGIQVIESILPNGDKSKDYFALLKASTSSKFGKNQTLEKERSARLKVGAPVDTCPFTDPNQNPPKAAKPFTTPMYIAVGRAFAGWTKMGLANMPRSGGYASVSFEGELFSDLRCGSHACNYWAPSTPTEDIRSWRVRIGGLLFGVQLHVPKLAPGGCYLTFHPNRRPKSSWTNGCFAAGTAIRMADHTLKPVERLEEGDLVYNPVTKGSAVVARTIAGPEVDPLIKLATDSGIVRVTRKHPFQTTEGLKAASDLKIDDRIIGSGGRPIAIHEIQVEVNDIHPIVYNFALKETSGRDIDHMVEANGVVTGDLFLQEKVSGIDPTKRPYTPSVLPYKELVTQLMLKPEFKK